MKGECAVATSSKVLVSVQHLVKEYNHGAVHALNDCSLDIRRGEVVAIIGPSGSGKSIAAPQPEPAGGPHLRRAIYFDGVTWPASR